MAKQALKQDARRTVREALSAKQKERVERERRHAGLAVDVLAALAERDEVVATNERAAATAVKSLLGEGLSIAQIVELCGEQVNAKEMLRLSKVEVDRTDSAPRG